MPILRRDRMKIRTLIASAILTAPIVSQGQVKFDPGLANKFNFICAQSLKHIEDSYAAKKKPLPRNFLEIDQQVRSVIGETDPQLVNLVTPAVLHAVNSAVKNVRDETSKRNLQSKLIVLTQMCAKSVQDEIRSATQK